jgi:ribosomal protein S20
MKTTSTIFRYFLLLVVFIVLVVYYRLMAITKGAKKAHRQSLRKKRFNDARKSAIRTTAKAARTAVKGDVKALAAAYKAIDKALKSKLIKKNTAARRKAKIAKLLSTK